MLAPSWCPAVAGVNDGLRRRVNRARMVDDELRIAERSARGTGPLNSVFPVNTPDPGRRQVAPGRTGRVQGPQGRAADGELGAVEQVLVPPVVRGSAPTGGGRGAARSARRRDPGRARRSSWAWVSDRAHGAIAHDVHDRPRRAGVDDEALAVVADDRVLHLERLAVEAERAGDDRVVTPALTTSPPPSAARPVASSRTRPPPSMATSSVTNASSPGAPGGTSRPARKSRLGRQSPYQLDQRAAAAEHVDQRQLRDRRRRDADRTSVPARSRA